MTAEATAAPAPTPTAAAAPSSASKLKCPSFAKLDRVCVPPRSTPSTGGNVPSPPGYSSWDKNGCYQANEIVGSCNGISQAAGPFFRGGQCCFDVCQGTPAPCGRPFVVQGRARVADVIGRGDWSASVVGLDAFGPLRAQAARAWRDDAAQEHASIASFARLSLELLAHGAPPALVTAAHRAALDEVEHARACFAIASELSDSHEPLGPAPLSLDGLSLSTDLESMAVRAAIEGCVGETIAALALSRASSACRAPLATHLSKMADDELSHASLAWECVAWAWSRLGTSGRDAIVAALDIDDLDAPAHETHTDTWHELGRLTRADMRQVVAEARTLVREAKERLLDG